MGKVVGTNKRSVERIREQFGDEAADMFFNKRREYLLDAVRLYSFVQSNAEMAISFLAGNPVLPVNVSLGMTELLEEAIKLLSQSLRMDETEVLAKLAVLSAPDDLIFTKIGEELKEAMSEKNGMDAGEEDVDGVETDTDPEAGDSSG